MSQFADAADLDAFLNTDDFGVKAHIAGKPVDGVFDDEYMAVELGIGVQSRNPVLMVKTSDVTAAVEGTTVVVPDPVTGLNVSYTVAEIRPDGTGITSLELQKT